MNEPTRALEYFTTDEPCGPDVVKLVAIAIALMFGSSATDPKFAAAVDALRYEFLLESPARIEWNHDEDPGEAFNSRLKADLDEVCVHANHPAASGEHVEDIDFVTGRIGSLAIRSTLLVYANMEEAWLAGFVAAQCASPDAAMAKAAEWAVADNLAYIRESVCIALAMGQNINGVSFAKMQERIRQAIAETTIKYT